MGTAWPGVRPVIVEDPVQVVRTEPSTLRECVQCRRAFGRLDEPAQLRHERCMLFGERRLIGFTAFAGAKSRALRVGRGRVESHVLRPCGPRAARRPAVHAGGADRVEERPVGGCVTRGDRGPARVGDGRGSERFGLGGHVHVRLSALGQG